MIISREYLSRKVLKGKNNECKVRLKAVLLNGADTRDVDQADIFSPENKGSTNA